MMRLHAEQGFRGIVTDLDTGLRVRKVIWIDVDDANPSHGTLLEAICTTAIPGVLIGDTYIAKGTFKVEIAKAVSQPERRGVPLGAPSCAKCKNPLTLPGDDLCAPCRAAERNQRNKMRVDRQLNVFEVRPCDGGCGRQAEWAVVDEVEASPVLAPAVGRVGGRSEVVIKREVAFARAAAVGRRFYCSWCFHGPKLLDARGELISVDDEAGGVRPQ